jgi:hypothetical protein
MKKPDSPCTKARRYKNKTNPTRARKEFWLMLAKGEDKKMGLVLRSNPLSASYSIETIPDLKIFDEL